MNNNTYSVTDNNNYPIDIKLLNIFDKKENGFFIELGANDGIKYSNTALLEFNFNWTGILIEPSEDAYLKCIKNRPNSIVLKTACVSNDFNCDVIAGDFDGSMMSSVSGVRRKSSELCYVSATTLTNILDIYKKQDIIIDFLSLDVEGYEFEVLSGLNLKKYSPNYILIEINNNDFDIINKLLNKNKYILIESVTNYNKTDNPMWDGTHNDFLFKLT